MKEAVITSFKVHFLGHLARSPKP